MCIIQITKKRFGIRKILALPEDKKITLALPQDIKMILDLPQDIKNDSGSATGYKNDSGSARGEMQFRAGQKGIGVILKYLLALWRCCP